MSGVYLPADSDRNAVRGALSRVTPSRRQLLWDETKFKVFIHFGLITCYDREWGDGTEDPARFVAAKADPAGWVSAAKSAGAGGVILVCKHHDGFCLWPSAHTEHCIRNSPYKEGKGDIVAEVSRACREQGLKFGVYLSPWDRHDPRYGTGEAYNRYYIAQLTELLTDYGDVDEVWLDGACAEGKNGKKQVYDWAGYYNTVRRLMPNAVISVAATDVRWCGNEAGIAREEEWSVQGQYLPPDFDEEHFVNQGLSLADGAFCMREDVGTLPQILEMNRGRGVLLTWFPCQVDTSIRPGWVYHRDEDAEVRSAKNLADLYFSAVGSNSQLLLNLPPDADGALHPRDLESVRGLGDYLRETFSCNLADNSAIEFVYEQGSVRFVNVVSSREIVFNVLRFGEEIRLGQQIEAFTVSVNGDEDVDKGAYSVVYRGKTVGSCRLIRFDRPIRARGIRIEILESRGKVTLRPPELFLARRLYDRPEIARSAQGEVEIRADYPVLYRVDAGAPKRYQGPFVLMNGGVVTAWPDSERFEGLADGAELVSECAFGISKAAWKLSSNAVEVGEHTLARLKEYGHSVTLLKGRFPVELQVEFPAERSVSGVCLLSKRLDWTMPVTLAMPLRCSVYALTGSGSAETVKDFRFDNMVNNPVARTIRFQPVRCSGLRLVFGEGADEEYLCLHDLQIFA